MSELIPIAVDAMGGDDAPAEIVKGAFKAAKGSKAKILLVGDEKAIKKHLPPLYKRRGIDIVHCDDYIRMDESAGTGLRKRNAASLVVAARLVKEGKAQALVSAGNTGALHQIALLEVGRLKGIRRPALAALLPSEAEPVLAEAFYSDQGGQHKFSAFDIEHSPNGTIVAGSIGQSRPFGARLSTTKNERGLGIVLERPEIGTTETVEWVVADGVLHYEKYKKG